MPVVKLWTPESVFYEGDVVTFDGGTFQATRDTGQPPTHAEHWIYLAVRGRDAKSPRVRGTFSADAQYQAQTSLPTVAALSLHAVTILVPAPVTAGNR